MYGWMVTTPTLTFVNPELQGQTFELPDGKTTVGRAPENTLIIEHGSVSWNHCVILTYGGEVIVRDNGSSNGTWIDGVRVQGQTAVQNGQTIQFASVQARLTIPRPRINTRDTEETAIGLHARASRKSAKEPKPAAPHTVIRPRLAQAANDL